MNFPEIIEVLVITLSDRAFKGEYEDLSGPRIRDLVTDHFKSENQPSRVKLELIPDDSAVLREKLEEASKQYNIIITTGGTGIGPRDITVETVKPLLDKEIPGIMEFIRIKYGSAKPNALLSRGVSGIIGRSLVYTLPGSLKAVEEYMAEILKTVVHLIYMQYGIDTHLKP
ncbi:MAG TPA: MogA/MoaB family molybdenum cofactor biosynthesis protein [Bacteroidales bacterium]|nr:MogA/MoaB family molybdenum cofactor biosynthesis protein [Bacteroidales bacterium]